MTQKWEYYLVLAHLVVLGESRTTPPGKTQTVSRLGLSEQQEESLLPGLSTWWIRTSYVEHIIFGITRA